jgi:hypothetical protein
MRRSISKVWLACVLAATGCVSAVNGVTDCEDVCERYDECVGGGFDATQCTNACRDASDYTDAFEERVDGCENCLEAAPCSPSCDEPCAGILPPF